MFLFLPQFFHLLYRLPAWNSVTYHIACVIACWFIFSTIHALDKEMATHSSVLAWRIPGTGEPGGLPSMGSHRVGQDWSDLAAAAAGYLIWKIHWSVETDSKNFIRVMEVHHDPFEEFEEARSDIWNMPSKILNWVDWLAQPETKEQKETLTALVKGCTYRFYQVKQHCLRQNLLWVTLGRCRWWLQPWN